MGKTLIIAEKPSVARDIAAALPESLEKKNSSHLESEHWIVSWAVGHLVRLSNPDEYKPEWKYWRMEELPMIPDKFKLKPASPKTSEQLKAIKALMLRDDVDKVINACDAGREGELIFRYIADWAKLKKPTERLWLASLTPEAIQQGLQEIKPGSDYDLLAMAAKGRSEADWLVGMNASRAATLVLRDWLGGAASIGRVQTPTLALLVGREIEIQAFSSSDYWTVSADFVAAADAQKDYSGQYEDGERFASEAEAQAIMDSISGQPGSVTKLDCQAGNEKQPQLYDLTSLQREASSAFDWTAAHTLEVAQSCYEKHKILTYPRTDSRWLPAAEGEKLTQLLKDISQLAPYQSHCQQLLTEPLKLKQVVNDSKVSDHYAIIPTNRVPSSSLPADEKRLYDMVARRLIAALGDSCQIERTRIETTVGGKKFVTKGRVVKEAGWRAVYETVSWTKNDQQPLPAMTEGEAVTLQDSQVNARQTKPPKRLNDSSLLGMMETAGKSIEDDEAREAMKDSGLGTPATRAATIERLITVGYAGREGKTLIPSSKGVSLITLLGDHPLASATLTGEWEKALNQIENGELEQTKFIAGINAFCQQIVEDMAALPEQLVDVPKLPEDERGGNDKRKAAKPLGKDIKCPGCGKAVMDGKKSWSCWQPGDAGCGMAIWKTVAGLALKKETALELLGPDHVTAETIEGFTSRKGAKFAAKLKLAQDEEGKWQTQFVFEERAG